MEKDHESTTAAMEMGTKVATKGGNVKPGAQVKSSSKTGMYAVFVIFALILVVCAITIPLALTQDDDIEPASVAASNK